MILAQLLEDLAGQKLQRLEFIVKTYGEKWEGLEGFENLKAFVEKLGEIDPTRNGAYMQWLAKLAIKNPSENRVEDLDRVGKDLRTFEANKAKLANKDLNSYKSYQELYAAVEQFYKKRPKTDDEKKMERAEKKLAHVKDKITTVYTGPEGWIKIPTTCDAAKFLGQNTRWCTSAKSSNMFAHYNATDSLFVVYDKKSKSRHQLHINSGQFADEKDANQGMSSVPEWAWPPIVEWYKQHAKITLKQILTLAKHAKADVGTGSEHEDLLNLMKQYGVI